MDVPKQRLQKEVRMSVNGVTDSTSVSYVSAQYNKTAAKEAKQAEKKDAAGAAQTANESGVVYESSTAEKVVNKTQYANPELVAKLKSDLEARTSQLQNIVTQMLSKQGSTFAKANDMWEILASGKFTVDAATKAQAQVDIAEDGYWGVEQTSDRIIDFAKALAGDDVTALEKMRDAFEKGYKTAEKTWGGELPEISQKTYDAVMKKFDELTQKKTEAPATESAEATTVV